MNSVSLSTILFHLQDYHPVTDCSTDIRFSSYMLYRPYYTSYSDETLYILREADYKDLPDIVEPAKNILFVRKKEDTPLPTLLLSADMLVTLEKDIDTVSLFQTLDVIFDNQIDLHALHMTLFEALCNDTELSRLMDLAHEMTGQILALSDMHLNILCRTGYEYLENLEHAYATSERQFFFSDDYYDVISSSPRFHSTSGKPVFYNRENPENQLFPPNSDPYHANSFIDCPLLQKGIRIGYLTMVGITRPVSENDLPIIETIAMILSLELSKSNQSSLSKSSYYESIFLDLVEERISDPLVLNIKLRSLKKNLIGPLRFITICAADDSRTLSHSSGVQDYLREYWQNCLSMHYQNKILLLTSGKMIKKMPRGKSSFYEYLRLNHLIAGISLSYHDPSKTKRYYEQSLKALELGPQYCPDSPVFHYQDVSIFDLLQQQAATQNLRDLCHPLILTLNDSPHSSDHELLQTLYVYLYSACDTKKAAEILHIHRNTFYYRLEKLQELLGDDLKSGDVIFQLMLSFQIIEYFSKLYTNENHLPFIGSIKRTFCQED